MIHGFNFPTAIKFGGGARSLLDEALWTAGIERPLIVTDGGVAGLPWFAELEGLARGREVGTFANAGGNPVVSQVEAGVAAFRAHQADGIIAVGGGAPMDVAKAIALLASHAGHLFDYEDGKATRPIDTARIPKIVAIPTTAGTGSEVGRSAVISDDETHAKKIIFDPGLLPVVVLADPELTLGLPAHITAATGMDALTHLVEAFLAKGYHPICDGIALEGIALVRDSLLGAVESARSGARGPDALQHRANMLLASMMGATAFQKGLGVTHSCAHALSTVCDTHHGLANAVMIEACMRFNLETEGERFLRMARVIDPGASSGADFVKWLGALNRSVGIPAGLNALGVAADADEALVAVAEKDACHPLNPRPVSREDFFRLYEDAR